MTKNYKSFVEATKWYSSHDELEDEERRNGFSGYYDYEPISLDDQNGGHGGDYYNDYGDQDEYGRNEEFDETDLDLEYRMDEDPKDEYMPGDEIVYIGNTLGKHHMTKSPSAILSRIREDGKYVIKIDDKLVAVSKQNLRHKISGDEIIKRQAELDEKKRLREIKKAEKEAKRLDQEEEAKKNPPPATGTRWWKKK